jgi:hypothetical protein
MTISLTLADLIMVSGFSVLFTLTCAFVALRVWLPHVVMQLAKKLLQGDYPGLTNAFFKGVCIGSGISLTMQDNASPTTDASTVTPPSAN